MESEHSGYLEYKVIQATTPLFANPRKMQAVLAEEARAGWQLVEKFDNYKLRLQRDSRARANDASLDFDAYRSQVGVSHLITYSAAALVTLAVVYGIFIAVGAA